MSSNKFKDSFYSFSVLHNCDERPS